MRKKELVIDNEYIRCAVCGSPLQRMTYTHLWNKHDMNFEDYRKYCKENDYTPVFISQSVLDKQAESAKIEEDLLIEDIQRVAEKVKGTVTVPKYRKYGDYDSGVFELRFGSWNNALKEAGLSLNKRHDIDDSKLLQDLIETSKEFDGNIGMEEYSEHGKYNAHTILRHFESWSKALDKAGLKANLYKKVKKSELLRDLLNVNEECEGLLTKEKYRKIGKFSTKPFLTRWRTWENAKRAAGLETYNVKKEEFLEKVARINKEIGNKFLTSDIFLEKTKYSNSVIYNHFEGWEEVLLEAGVITKDYRCNYCDMSFGSYRGLSMHLRYCKEYNTVLEGSK